MTEQEDRLLRALVLTCDTFLTRRDEHLASFETPAVEEALDILAERGLVATSPSGPRWTPASFAYRW